MAGKGQLVLAFFESEEAADTAVDALNQWAKTNRRVELATIGVLVPANQATAISAELEALGGEAEQHTVAAPQGSPAGAQSAT